MPGHRPHYALSWGEALRLVGLAAALDAVDVDRERAFRLDEDRPPRDARELAEALIDAAVGAERGR